MPDVRADLERNAASLARLRAVVGALSDADLDRPLSGGWTVKVALGHLAFWDGRQRAVIERSLAALARDATLPPMPEEAADVVNEALLPLLVRVDAASAASLAMEAAEAVDGTLARVDVAALERLADGAGEWIGQRWRHREEHLEQLAGAR